MVRAPAHPLQIYYYLTLGSRDNDPSSATHPLQIYYYLTLGSRDNDPSSAAHPLQIYYYLTLGSRDNGPSSSPPPANITAMSGVGISLSCKVIVYTINFRIKTKNQNMFLLIGVI